MAIKKKNMTLIIVCALLLGGGFYLYQNFGNFITRTAERIASDALGVPVNIGSIRVSLSDKKVSVNSLKIGNPPGYRGAHAMTADAILIGFNTASKELIDFKDIQVKGSVVYLEVNEKGMNLVDLKTLANQRKQKESVGSEQIRVIVRNMLIDASIINSRITFVDHDIPPINMPPLTFSNIGSGRGIEAKDAIVQILSRYFTSVEKEARKSGMLNDIPGMNDARKAIDDAATNLKKLFD